MNLFSRIKTFAANKKQLYFLFAVGLPTVIIAIALIIILIVNITSLKSLNTDHSLQNLTRIATTSESKISYLLDCTKMFSNSPILTDSLKRENTDFDYRTSEELKTIVAAFPYLDNAYILSKDRSTICSVDGTYTALEYFNEIYCYKNYSVTDWQNLRFYNNSNYQLLSPSVVTTPSDSKEVLSIVMRKIDGTAMKNLLVLDINLTEFIGHNPNSLSTNYKVYLLNKHTNEVFTSDGTMLDKNAFPTNFYEQLVVGTRNTFEYTLYEENIIVTTYATNNTLSGYLYFALIPTSTITSSILPNIILSLIIVLIFAIMSGIMVFRNASNIFTPLNRLSESLASEQIQSTDNINIIKDISAFVENLQQSHRSLYSTLPYAQEKYLINFLNATDFFIDENTSDILKKSLNFSNDFFAVIIVQMAPKHELYDLYSKNDYTSIQLGFYKLIKNMFEDEFDSFVLPSEANSLYIILNLKKEHDIKKADNILNNIYDALKNDLPYISFAIGKSSVYNGLNGLRQAHIEATDSLMLYTNEPEQISLGNYTQNESVFNGKTQSDFFAAILSSDSKKAYEIVNDLSNKIQNAPLRVKKNLYNQLLNIVIKTIHIKKTPFKDNRLDFEIINDIMQQPPDDIKKELLSLLSYIIESAPDAGDNTNISEIIKYIDDNYTFSELSLEYLSKYFHISSSNLSNLIKITLGVGFHEYITMRRINKAKDLLADSEKSVADIFPKCGFSSQQTFYRTFRKVVGVTPTEFRKRKDTL